MSDDPQSPLRRSLGELSSFLVTDQSLGDTLTRVATLAVESIDSARMAGITMMVDGKPSTQAFTDPTCTEIDRAQYESGHGPCLDAFRNRTTIVVDSLAEDARWPDFAASASAHGVRSTMSLPMTVGEHAVGAMNIYADVPRAFGDAEISTGHVFAAQAAVVLANAQAYWGARLTSEHLQVALEGREPIDLAKGIIMNSMGCSPDEAFAVLVKQSQHENRKLREIAAEIVARAQRQRS